MERTMLMTDGCSRRTVSGVGAMVATGGGALGVGEFGARGARALLIGRPMGDLATDMHFVRAFIHPADLIYFFPSC